MSDKLILVLNCGSSSLKGAVLDNETGDVLMTCLAEKMGHADAYITFKANGNKERVELTAKPDHTGAVEALLEELKKLGLYDNIRAIGHRVVSGGEPRCTTPRTCWASAPRKAFSKACPMLPCLIPRSTKPCPNTPIPTPSRASITAN